MGEPLILRRDDVRALARAAHRNVHAAIGSGFDRPELGAISVGVWEEIEMAKPRIVGGMVLSLALGAVACGGDDSGGGGSSGTGGATGGSSATGGASGSGGSSGGAAGSGATAGTGGGGTGGGTGGGGTGGGTGGGGTGGSTGGTGGSGGGATGGAGGTSSGCNSFANTGPTVVSTAGTGAPPTMTGGTVVTGTYHLTQRVQYGTNPKLHTSKETLTISGSGPYTLEEAQILDGVEVRYSYTAKSSGTNMDLDLTCPAQTKLALTPYTATATTITFVGSQGAEKWVDTWTLK